MKLAISGLKAAGQLIKTWAVVGWDGLSHKKSTLCHVEQAIAVH